MSTNDQDYRVGVGRIEQLTTEPYRELGPTLVGTCCPSCKGTGVVRKAEDYGLTPTLAAVRMALNAYDGNERQTLEEIQETVRHALTVSAHNGD